MNKFWKEIGTVVLLSMLLPGILLNTARILYSAEPVPQTLPLETTETVKDAEAVMIRVLTEDGTVVPMELEAYLVGVVLGEMPEEFELEALKAQAVVARTYTLRMCRNTAKHPDADVCVRSDCCQSYRAGESEKIRAAVEATAGLVLTYEGALIEATYFSSSGGRTEDALAVWGNDVPYLRSTDSPEDGFSDQILETVTYTNGGGVDTMEIGGAVFQGTELRKLLGLRSTAFVMTAVGDHITITTRGYGHRVGMSQYGAEAMAVDGATFQEILSHYYQGTTLEEFVDKDSPIG